MKAPIKDHYQQKATGGEQKVILDPAETAETDELDPKFDENNFSAAKDNSSNPEPDKTSRTN